MSLVHKINTYYGTNILEPYNHTIIQIGKSSATETFVLKILNFEKLVRVKNLLIFRTSITGNYVDNIPPKLVLNVMGEDASPSPKPLTAKIVYVYTVFGDNTPEIYVVIPTTVVSPMPLSITI